MRWPPSLAHDFPAPILFVQHIGALPGELWKLVNARSEPGGQRQRGRPAPAQPGTIYIAPPDHHILLDAQVIRLSRGPKERHARPAIDPLFHSAALYYSSCAIGVVLTGMLDDGSTRLWAIEEGGGTPVAQNPADAYPPRMTQSALACVTADHVVPLARLGSLLYDLAYHGAAASSGLLQRPDRPARPASDSLRLLHPQGAG